MTRKQELAESAERIGLYVRTYSPGDGVTRYRFFTNPENDYFGPENGICTVLGLKAAKLFILVNRDRKVA